MPSFGVNCRNYFELKKAPSFLVTLFSLHGIQFSFHQALKLFIFIHYLANSINFDTKSALNKKIKLHLKTVKFFCYTKQEFFYYDKIVEKKNNVNMLYLWYYSYYLI